MKTRIILLSLLTTTVALFGCYNIKTSTGEKDRTPDFEDNIAIEAMIVERVLLTEDEFVQLIQKNNSALGVTVEDFEGIEVNDFIFRYGMSIEFIDELLSGSSLTISRLIERYKKDLEEWEQTKQMLTYFSMELRSADSTDDEYKEFIDSFFESIQIKAEHYRDEPSGLVVYRAELGNNKGITYFWFCQTGKSSELNLKRGYKVIFPALYEYPFTVEVSDGTDGGFGLDIYYSKNGKFLMCFDADFFVQMSFDERLRIIKAFCEMED